MFDNIIKFFKKLTKSENKDLKSKDSAKERLHLVLMQDRANISADFLDLMKQEIIEVIKKYIDVDEKEIDVRLTNKTNDDGTNGAPVLYANIPIVSIKEDVKKKPVTENAESTSKESKSEEEHVEEDNKQSEEQKDTEIVSAVESEVEDIEEEQTEEEKKEETTKQIDEACEIIEEISQEEKKEVEENNMEVEPAQSTVQEKQPEENKK